MAHTDHNIATLQVLANAVPPTTADMLCELQANHGYKFYLDFVDEPLGGGAVTNRVMQLCVKDGPFVYHTASDFYFRAGWLEGLLANMPVAEAMGIGLLGAYSHPFHRTDAVVPGVAGYQIHVKQMVSGGSWFMRWATWDRFGPLNEDHHGNWVGSEDSQFNERLIAAGVGRATLVPEGCVHTGKTASNGQPTLGHEYMYPQEGILIE